MSWLEQHIETFVKPELDKHGCEFHPSPKGDWFFTQEELTVIKNIWRSVKKNAQGRQVLLPGRDVFIFEILARRENYPTVFAPECSRMTVRKLMQDWWKMRDLYLFDTGFAGSIPRNLRTKRFGLMSYANRDNVDVQIFPRLTMSRHLALKIESTPKYWESARLAATNTTTGGGGWYETMPEISTSNLSSSAIIQPLSNPGEFLRAAQLTVEIYTNSAPKFINEHKPIRKEFSWQ